MNKKIVSSIALQLLFTGICISIFSFTNTANGQVVIRDSISISSMMDTTNASQPAQKSFSVKGVSGEALYRTNSVNPRKSVNALISLPDGGGITVTVIGGNAGARLDLVVRSPFYKVLVENANAHHGFTWDTTGFPSGTTFNIGIN